MRIYKSLEQAFLEELSIIMKDGIDTSPRGMPSREITDSVFRIQNPRSRLIFSESRNWSPFYAIGELFWHLTPTKDLSFISYYSRKWKAFSDDEETLHGSCYGYKIFSQNSNGYTQWQMAKKLLQDDPQTRRAVITLYDSEIELASDSKDLPCSCSLQFLMRDGALNMIVYMRSNDIITGFGYDIFLFTILQELMALELNTELGWYQHIAASLHIYESNYEVSKLILNEKPSDHRCFMDRITDLNEITDVLKYERIIRESYDINTNIQYGFSKFWCEILDVLLFYKLKKLGRFGDIDVILKRQNNSCFYPLLMRQIKSHLAKIN